MKWFGKYMSGLEN